MRRTFVTAAGTAALAIYCFLPLRWAAAHCEVPCGIYDDQMRFEMMLEHQATIAKAITSIQDLASEMSEGADAQAINQVTRWVTTKEDHATQTQHIIAQYFMTQRIKADDPAYAKKLSAAHAVMVAAMKCKQQANSATDKALRAAIYDFYRAYTGKEPRFESQN